MLFNILSIIPERHVRGAVTYQQESYTLKFIDFLTLNILIPCGLKIYLILNLIG